MPKTASQSSTVRVNVSMVSVKWGDVLSMFLPDTVALLALSSWIPELHERFVNLKTVSVAEGFALLIGSVLAGGILEVVYQGYLGETLFGTVLSACRYSQQS